MTFRSISNFDIFNWDIRDLNLIPIYDVSKNSSCMWFVFTAQSLSIRLLYIHTYIYIYICAQEDNCLYIIN